MARFVPCPHCSAIFHESKLSDHIEFKHPIGGARPNAKQALEQSGYDVLHGYGCDENTARQDILFDWAGEDFYLIKYFPIAYADSVTYFILAFKNSEASAIDGTIKLFASAIGSMERELRDVHRCKYIIAIPPSRANQFNDPCERVCAAIASRFAWLTYLRGALVRTKTVPSAHRSPSWNRPTYDDHLQTIEYRGPTLSNDASVIMVDDLQTRGDTSHACRDILQRRSSCLKVIGMYLGKTR